MWVTNIIAIINPASRSLAVAIEGIAGLLYIIAEMKDLYTLDDLDELCKEYNFD